MKHKIYDILIIITSILCLSFSFCGCQKEPFDPYKDQKEPPAPPQTEISSGEYMLDFDTISNDVMTTLNNQAIANNGLFSFVKDFKIDGNNENKTITITCISKNDAKKDEDLDLFLSLVINEIGQEAAIQDFRFTVPYMDDDGTYLDFGTVYNYYDLIIDSKYENGNDFSSMTIKKGNKIPFESKYWSE